MLTRMIVGLAVGIISTQAIAQQAVSETYDYVTKVHVKADNYLYVAVSGNYKSSHGCDNLAYARSDQPITNDVTKAYLQIAMASFLSRAKVNIGTENCSAPNNSSVNYPRMMHLQIQQ